VNITNISYNTHYSGGPSSSTAARTASINQRSARRIGPEVGAKYEYRSGGDARAPHEDRRRISTAGWAINWS
jgi:hypothetical protein